MRKWTKLLAVLAVMALIAAACSNEPAEETTTTAGETTTTAAQTTTTASDTTTTEGMMEIATDVGVTEEPCEGGNPDHGCIYLGVLTDESGPFKGAAAALYGGQQLFWASINAAGGIGGAYDVALPADLKKDTGYTEEGMVTQYSQIADQVAAVAQSLGTPPTLAVLSDYERDHTVAAPMSWWSGYAFAEADGPGDFTGEQGRILEFGTNYCFEAMNAVDWAAATIPALGREFKTAGIAFFPSDYGLDYAAGVGIAAVPNGVEIKWSEPVIPVALSGAESQPDALAKIQSDPVDIVFLSVGPTESAQIVGGAAQLLDTSVPLFIGSAPSWNVALLASPAAPAFQSGIFFQSSFLAGWDYDSPGHATMAAYVDGAGLPANDFFGAGWTSQYALKQVLEDAYAAGDLTKAGIEAAAAALGDVEYDGMMPSRTFQGDPDDITPRTSVMHKYDAEATTGMAVIADASTSDTGYFVGPTATGFAFTEACSAPEAG